ncbi:MAG: hydroxymethylbilane synthase [Planctomycetes bacterium]|nr:hydroxymethylbilane synthase [Planctomycetota bacterium]MCL4729228.1 hydroxymethylbilane synthase [Planctomycetota bacterium]
MSSVRIATRGSLLALTQSRWVAAELQRLHAGLRVELVEIRTTGDIRLGQSLTAIGGKGAFTRELEDALLDGRADLAVHSLKDLPTVLPDGLALACTPAREDTGDVMLLRDRACAGDPFALLPKGVTVGSSSPRRRAQLLARRSDFNIIEFRGNVDTRLRKLGEGKADAIVLARAGLKRLGLLDGIEPLGAKFGIHALDGPLWLPAVGQGSLGVEIRAGDQRLGQLLAPLHDAATWAEVSAERAFLRVLGAGCTAPVGAAARAEAGQLRMWGAVFAPDGQKAARVQGVAGLNDAENLGTTLARQAAAQGV